VRLSHRVVDTADDAGAACNLIPGRIETMTHRFTNARDRSGLFITIALHAGVAAIALLAVTTTTLTRPPPPISTRPIPDTAQPVPEAPAPLTRELAIPFDVPLPEPVIDIAPDADTRPLITAPEPPVRPADPGTGTIVVADPPPAGPTRSARLDPRFAAQPPYPAASRRLGEEGLVIVHVRIGRDGRVLAATLARSSGYPRLDAAALAHALASWRFTPALAAGVAVEATRDIKVDFRLASAQA
jgi:protein TonB